MPELQVTVKRAVDLRDVQMIGRQDPYCDVLLGNLAFRTRVHENGGTDPFWEETFVIPVANPQVEELDVFIRDSGWISDEHIGTCRIPVSAFLHGQYVDQWFPVHHGHH
ncbi:hypothetical protein LEN26_011240 [Aphanomyces euteiches]|nr:hypothetical protein LEN26_011240 [Aphanomyces euteiches]KAH9193772.1 hypothetical protein AeNC1_004239 [Aphanomyces euteiches]